jgi:HSP20 family molecular chaperone IbpA
MTLLTSWESLREFSAMQERMNRMNRLFREPYSPEGPEEALTTTTLAPPVDIYEDEHNILLKIEVPGIDESDINVRIQNNASHFVCDPERGGRFGVSSLRLASSVGGRPTRARVRTL